MIFKSLTRIKNKILSLPHLLILAVLLICPTSSFFFLLTTLLGYDLSIINCIYLMSTIGWILTEIYPWNYCYNHNINIAIVSLCPFAIHLFRDLISRQPVVLPVLKWIFWLWTKWKIFPENGEISQFFSHFTNYIRRFFYWMNFLAFFLLPFIFTNTKWCATQTFIAPVMYVKLSLEPITLTGNPPIFWLSGKK